MSTVDIFQTFLEDNPERVPIRWAHIFFARGHGAYEEWVLPSKNERLQTFSFVLGALWSSAVSAPAEDRPNADLVKTQ